jgi:hypothetical protein
MLTIFVGAGDISDCGEEGDEVTAALLDGIPGVVFTVGDNVYEEGTAPQFAECYHPSWGRHRDRTRPTPGDHDFRTEGASGTSATSARRPATRGRGITATIWASGTSSR